MYIHHDSLLTAQGRGEKKSQSYRDVFLRVPGHISQELLSLKQASESHSPVLQLHNLPIFIFCHSDPGEILQCSLNT